MAEEWTVDTIRGLRTKPLKSDPLIPGAKGEIRKGEKITLGEEVQELKDGELVETWVKVKSGTKGGFLRSRQVIALTPDIPRPFKSPAESREVDIEYFADVCVRRAVGERTNAAYLFALAWVESGEQWTDELVRSPKDDAGGAKGCFRYMPKVWKELVKLHGEEEGIQTSDIVFPLSQCTFAAIQAREAEKGITNKLGRNIRALDLYLAHLFGVNGALEIAKAETGDKSESINDVLSRIYPGDKPKIDTIIKRKTEFLSDNPTVEQFLKRCIAKIDDGFKKVKDVAMALAPEVPADGAGASMSGSSSNLALGALSEEFESLGNSAAIGFDKKGGHSYGKYQIATRTGTFASFMKFVANKFTNLAENLKKAGGTASATKGTQLFQSTWKSLRGNADFEASQHDFIQLTHYDPLVAALQKIGLDANQYSLALQNVIWSVAVQHGTKLGRGVFEKALKSLSSINGTSEKQIIKALYAERSKVSIHFKSSTAKVKASVKRRFKTELSRAIAMLA
jgi:hypothetical protein